MESSALWWSSPRNALRPRSHALFSGCINANTGPMFNVPKKFGNCSNDDPGSHVVYPQPTELLRITCGPCPVGPSCTRGRGQPFFSTLY